MWIRDFCRKAFGGGIGPGAIVKQSETNPILAVTIGWEICKSDARRRTALRLAHG